MCRQNLYFYCTTVLLILSFQICSQDFELDQNFGISGVGEKWGTTSSHNRGMQVDPTGRIYLFGGGMIQGQSYLDPTIVRYRPDGMLDDSFGVEGKVFVDAERGGLFTDLAFQSDGKIIVVGDQQLLGNVLIVYRLLENGTIDSTFANNGLLFSTRWEVRAVQVLADDRILISGDLGGNHSQVTVLKFEPNGEIDYTFGASGFAIGEDEESGGFNHNLALDDFGNIVVFGKSQFDLIVKKFDARGNPDPSFGQSGIVRFKNLTGENLQLRAGAIAVQADQKIVLAFENSWGVYRGWGLIRFLPNGQLDSNFGSGGISLLPRPYFDRLFTPQDMAVDEQGRVWVSGSSYTHNWPSDYKGAFALFDPIGNIASQFAENGLAIGLETAQGIGMKVEGDKILIGGAYGFSVSQYVVDLINSNESTLSVKSFMKVYPNPVRGAYLRIDYHITRPENGYQIEVRSVDGSLQHLEQLRLDQSGVLSMPIGDWPNGAYICRLSGSNLNLVQKFIVAQ